MRWALLLRISCSSCSNVSGTGNSVSCHSDLCTCGIVINAVSKAVIMGLKYFADPENELAAMEYWEMGTLGNTTAAKVMTVFPLFCVGVIGIILLRRQIEMLALSDNECRALRMRIGIVRTIILLLTLLVAAIICVTGLISFVGLIAPHIAKLILKKK